ncbi:thiamine pyrophosphate-dependent enzyme [Streptomyces cylindrosporus]|uniref:Thiamine pyrophosphate-dependent enzyme n=1 Tax=Streptomyces cylindrosporus TaxID=2927583 RepID=A0ABS9Y3G4_9ACTN|nr:thiamine pyrophosphate-dependent enzyme [Streptomyces cylindrosporus]MCI3271752.1 thiamine pyrophosphate-dependent enzyme [Streptomyces cylindrosporus]
MKTSEGLAYEALSGLIARLSGDERHESSSSSTLDVLWVLYDQVLNVSPATVDSPDRDRFLLSKGHGPMAYYAVLAAKGFIEPGLLDGWARFGSPLGHEPDRTLVPGVEMSAGSLGHGLPIAVGSVLGLRAQDRTRPRVVVLLGDGELDEGSNHEAIALAGRLGLDQITAVVIDNSTATHGWPGGIDQRFAVEGWQTRNVDGHDHAALHTALTTEHPGRPLAVVARITPTS